MKNKVVAPLYSKVRHRLVVCVVLQCSEIYYFAVPYNRLTYSNTMVCSTMQAYFTLNSVLCQLLCSVQS